MFNFLQQDRSQRLSPIAGGLSPIHERKLISEGVRGTEETLVEIQKLVSKGKIDIEVRKKLGEILRGEIDGIPACKPKDYYCYAKAIYTFCRDKILYVYDPHLVEYVESARNILYTRVADCDSICVLMAALFECAGFEAQFVTIMADVDRPSEFSHIYGRVNVPRKGWISCDPTMPWKEFGWEAPGKWKRRYWHGSTTAVTAGLPIDEDPSLPTSQLSGMRGLSEMSDLGQCPMCGAAWCNPNCPICQRRMAAAAGVPSPYPVGMNAMDAEESAGMSSDLFGLGKEDELMCGIGGGMCGLSAVSKQQEDSILTVLNKIWDGTYAEELRDKQNAIAAQNRELSQMAHEAASMPKDKQDIVLENVRRGQDMAYRANLKMVEAIGKYDFIVGEAKNLGINLKKYQDTVGTKKMSGMGALGVGWLALPAGLSTATVALAAVGLIGLMIELGALINGTDGVIVQTRDLIKSVGTGIQQTGEGLRNVVIAAGIGVLVMILWQNRKEISAGLKRLVGRGGGGDSSSRSSGYGGYRASSYASSSDE